METRDDLITVVIPVYNLEQYVKPCIESVLMQTYQNIEILLFDDGSTDTSPEICDEYAKKDTRVRVIHKKNEGVSVIRNIGAKEAKGAYIAHIDGDDILTPAYIEYLYKLVVEYDADISICNFISFMDGTEIPKEKAENGKEDIEVMTKKQALEALLYQKYFTTATWAKLYKRELLLKVEFPYGRLAQDMDSTYKLFHYSNKVVYSSKIQYYYLQRASSVVHACLSKREKDYIELSGDMVKFIEVNYPDLIQAAYSRCFSSNIQVLSTISFNKIYDQSHKININNIKKYRKDVLFNSNARIVNRGCALISYFGIWVLRLGLMIFK